MLFSLISEMLNLIFHFKHEPNFPSSIHCFINSEAGVKMEKFKTYFSTKMRELVLPTFNKNTRMKHSELSNYFPPSKKRKVSFEISFTIITKNLR